MILEGSNVSCFGTIRTTDEDVLQTQNLIYDNKSEFDVESDTTLDSSDIYKDLRIRGYDYGPEFQGVQEVRNVDTYKSYGKVKWTGNIISFMDSVLQVPLISIPFKKILVPVMISSLRCDPKVLFDAIEECKQILEESVKKEDTFTNLEKVFEEREEQIKEMNINPDFDAKDEALQTAEVKDIVGNLEIIEERTESASKKYFSVLPLFADMNLKTIVTHGLEIKGMIAAPIPRMLDTQELKLESYQFIPNDENEAIGVMFKKEVTEYIEVRKLFFRAVIFSKQYIFTNQTFYFFNLCIACFIEKVSDKSFDRIIILRSYRIRNVGIFYLIFFILYNVNQIYLSSKLSKISNCNYSI